MDIISKISIAAYPYRNGNLSFFANPHKICAVIKKKSDFHNNAPFRPSLPRKKPLNLLPHQLRQLHGFASLGA